LGVAEPGWYYDNWHKMVVAVIKHTGVNCVFYYHSPKKNYARLLEF